MRRSGMGVASAVGGSDAGSSGISAETAGMLCEILAESPFFSGLDSQALAQISYLFRIAEFQRNDWIVEHGADQECFFVLLEGQCAYRDAQGPRIEVGGQFCEEALVFAAKALDGITVVSDTCKVAALDRLAYQEVIVSGAAATDRTLRDFLIRLYHFDAKMLCRFGQPDRRTDHPSSSIPGV